MFVVASKAGNDLHNRLYQWANKSEFPAQFVRATCRDGRWTRVVVCDDEVGAAGGHWEVGAYFGIVFYAKDKQTLRDGLKSCLPSARITAQTGQIAIYCGSYDFEGIGAWAKSKIEAIQQWDALTKTGEADSYKEKGLGKNDFMKFKDRIRLLKRGHFALVGINATMSRMEGVVPTHSAEMMLRTLGHWVT